MKMKLKLQLQQIGARRRYRAPLHRKLRRMMRNAAQMHDIWAAFYGILFIAILLLMEVFRCI